MTASRALNALTVFTNGAGVCALGVIIGLAIKRVDVTPAHLLAPLVVGLISAMQSDMRRRAEA